MIFLVFQVRNDLAFASIYSVFNLKDELKITTYYS
jgi:hypothetical protein